MPVFFIYRTPHNHPTTRFIKKLDAHSILDWFQKIWRTDLEEEQLYLYLKEKFGTHFYGLGHLSYNISKNKTPCPDSLSKLIMCLEKYTYMTSVNLEKDKYLQVETDDDEKNMAWYMIEEEYANRYPNRFEFLIRENPELPVDFSSQFVKDLEYIFKYTSVSKSPKEGAIFFMGMGGDGGDYLVERYPIKIEGIRLPEILQSLAKGQIDLDSLPIYMNLCQEFLEEKVDFMDISLIEYLKIISPLILNLYKLIYHHPGDLDAYEFRSKADFENGFSHLKEMENNLSKLKEVTDITIHGGEHFIQISIQIDFWRTHPVDDHIKDSKVFEQIYIFDDLWVNGNYSLANSLVSFCTSFNL